MNEKGRTNERGQSLVLVAAAMIVLVMFVAVAVDLSNAYYARRTAQNAADGAALAGASRLATGINNEKKLDGQIQEDMNDFAERNGIEDTNNTLADDENDNVEGWYVDTLGNRIVINGIEIMVGSGAVPDGAAGVEAITHIDADAYFGGIFGVGGYAIQARAVSQMKLACGSDCLVPMITRYDLLPPEDPVGEPPCYHIWRERVLQNDEVSAGLLGWVSWTWQETVCKGGYESCGISARPCPYITQDNGCDNPLLIDNMNPDYCASGFVKVGDWISGAPGDMGSSGARCALDHYIDFYDPLNPCTDELQRSITVPVYDYLSTNYPVGNPYQTSDSTCGPMPNPCNPYEGANSYVVHYHVAGLARMNILQYQLSEGVGSVKYPPDEALTPEQLARINSCASYYDFLCDPADPTCDVNEKKNNGFRITVEFIEWVSDYNSDDDCEDPFGTLWASPKLTW